MAVFKTQYRGQRALYIRMAGKSRVAIFLDAAGTYEARPVYGLQNMDIDVIAHRQSAANVLVYLANEYRAGAESLVHALVLLDRYISSAVLPASLSNVMSSTRAAVACFMISVKIREVEHPILHDLMEITSIGCQHLLHSEQIVLESLEWDIYPVSGDVHRTLFIVRNDWSDFGPDTSLQGWTSSQ